MFDLKFDQVSKKYRIRQEEASKLSRNRLIRKLQSLLSSKEFWALRNVSFEVERGEVLGIIGPNGAGKSTVLKLLSNITAPTEGEIKINGSLSALIEVGSGFHPELTGRENIYLSGSILGMRRREITKNLEAIVEFAGIKAFLDVPAKRYSSGMYVRMGFSIAAHLEPDILLLDEVLAVGDLAFQAKCLQRIDDLRRAGTTIVFISHDLGAVQRLCNRVLLMQRGEIVASGTPLDVVNEYQHMDSDFKPPLPYKPFISKTAEITSMRFFNLNGTETNMCFTGDPLVAKVEYVAYEQIEDCVFEIFFYSGDREMHCQFTTEVGGGQIDLEPGKGFIEFSCDEIGLLPGLYNIDIIIKHRGAPAGYNIDWQYQRVILRVDPGKMARGRFYAPHQWRYERIDDVPYGSVETSLNRQAFSKI